MKRELEDKREIKGGKRSKKDGEGEEERKRRKKDFKRTNKITPSLGGNCLLCGLRGNFPTALGSFSSLLKCRINYSRQHKLKSPKLLLQSKRLGSGRADSGPTGHPSTNSPSHTPPLPRSERQRSPPPHSTPHHQFPTLAKGRGLDGSMPCGGRWNLGPSRDPRALTFAAVLWGQQLTYRSPPLFPSAPVTQRPRARESASIFGTSVGEGEASKQDCRRMEPKPACSFRSPLPEKTASKIPLLPGAERQGPVNPVPGNEPAKARRKRVGIFLSFS